MSSTSEELSTQIAVFYLILAPVVAAAAYIFRHCFVVLRQGENMVLERRGFFLKILTPGFHLLAPVVDRPRAISWRAVQLNSSRSGSYFAKTSPTRIDLRQQVLDFAQQDMLTMDNIPLQLGCSATLEIADVKKAAYSVQNLADSIELLLLAELRAIISQQAFSSICGCWDAINARLYSSARGGLERWGVRLLRASVSVIRIPDDIKEALDFEIHEEKERRAYILEADGARESAITRSRGAAAQTVLLAEADKAVSIQRARGDAEAKIIVAQVSSTAESMFMPLTCGVCVAGGGGQHLRSEGRCEGRGRARHRLPDRHTSALKVHECKRGFVTRACVSACTDSFSIAPRLSPLKLFFQYLNSLSKVTMDSSGSEVILVPSEALDAAASSS